MFVITYLYKAFKPYTFIKRYPHIDKLLAAARIASRVPPNVPPINNTTTGFNVTNSVNTSNIQTSTIQEQTPTIREKSVTDPTTSNVFKKAASTGWNNIKELAKSTVINNNSNDTVVTSSCTNVSTVNSTSLGPIDASQKVITQLINQGLATYADTTEGGKKSGELILTKQGSALYLETTVKNLIPNNTKTDEENPTFNLGLLRPCHNMTIMLGGIHTHLVIYYNFNLNQYVAVGYLTSEKTDFKLADTQELSNNSNKKQFVQPFTRPLLLHKLDLEKTLNDEKFDNYIQASDKKKILEDVKKAAEQFQAVPYDPSGMNVDKLINLLETSKLKKVEMEIMQQKAEDFYSKRNSLQNAKTEEKITKLEKITKNLDEFTKKEIRKEAILDAYQKYIKNKTK